MKCKEGVEIVKGGICVTAEILHAMAVADVVCGNFGVEPVCTAMLDGKHMTGSKHYSGNAFDLRSRDVPEGQRQAFRDVTEDPRTPLSSAVCMSPDGCQSPSWPRPRRRLNTPGSTVHEAGRLCDTLGGDTVTIIPPWLCGAGTMSHA